MTQGFLSRIAYITHSSSMNTKEEKASELISKYKSGDLTPKEEERLNEWYLFKAAEIKEELTEAQMEEAVELLRSRLPVLRKPKVTRMWPQVISIAAAIALLVCGIIFFKYNAGNNEGLTQSAGTDVLPGKMGATLTLGNGKKIRLSEVSTGKIATEPGITVSKTANGQIVYQIVAAKDGSNNPNPINTLSTAKGETYMLILPDQSKVWMNSASSISFTSNLSDNGMRRVKVEGEAYFEITKDKRHPFIVESKNQQIKVLGTHFNINSYANEPVTSTTLLEGSLQVVSGNDVKIIRPGQQALTKNGTISVSAANIESVTDWKDGDFYLNHLNFKVAMRKIARWYDVEVIFDPSFPDDVETGGWISRDQKLSVVLKLIESSGQVHFKIRGKKVFVSK